MKKMSKCIVAALLMISFLSCSEAPKTQEATVPTQEAAAPTQPTATETKVAYACPMNCEKDKTYDVAGKCPVCKMDLVAQGDKKEGHTDKH
jgi:Heavy metal binding domain